MRYTIRDVPPEIDHLLRDRVKTEGKSLNQVAIEALARGMGAARGPVRYRDLSDLAGTWVEDPVIDEALADQRRHDEECFSEPSPPSGERAG